MTFLSYNFKSHAAAAAKSLQLCPTLCEPIDSSPSGPPSLGFSRQEYWSRLPFPSPGDLHNAGIEPGSPALQTDALPSDPLRKPILKEISPKYSLEGLMLKLKLKYFGQLMRRTYSLEKTLMLGKIEGRRRG